MIYSPTETYQEFQKLNETDIFSANQSQTPAGKHNREMLNLDDMFERHYRLDLTNQE